MSLIKEHSKIKLIIDQLVHNLNSQSVIFINRTVKQHLAQILTAYCKAFSSLSNLTIFIETRARPMISSLMVFQFLLKVIDVQK